MKIFLHIACLFLTLELSAVVIELEKPNIPPLIKLKIETLNKLISAYFNSEDAKHSKVIIVNTSQMLKQNEIFIISRDGKIEIHLPDKAYDLSLETIEKIALVIIACHLDLYKNNSPPPPVPAWISLAFTYRALKDIKKPIIKTPYFPLLRSFIISGVRLDYFKLLSNDNTIMNNQFFLELRSELAWAILYSLKKHGRDSKLKETIINIFQNDNLSEEEVNKEILERCCIPDDYDTLMCNSSFNYFFPYPPRICVEILSSMKAEVLDSLYKKYENEEIALSKKNSAMIKFISDLRDFSYAVPPLSQKKYQEFLTKLEGLKQHEQMSEYLEKFDIGDIFKNDMIIYNFLLDSEKKVNTPGKKYHMILNELAVKTKMEITDILNK